MLELPPTRELVRKVAALPASERFHLLFRLRTVPWRRILAFFDADGSLLDVGCGPGLFALLVEAASFRGHYVGVDPDPRKVERARRFPGERGGRRFLAGTVFEAPEGPFAQVALIDVLYLAWPPDRRALLGEAARRLLPGGRLVAVTSGGGPRWKRGIDRLQELVSVRLFGRTRGEAVAPCDGAEVADYLRAAGLAEVEVVDIGRGYAHGFELVRGTRI